MTRPWARATPTARRAGSGRPQRAEPVRTLLTCNAEARPALTSSPAESPTHKLRTSMKRRRDDIASELECPVCEQLITPPVMRCRKNHYLCSGCRDGLSPKR